MSTTGKARFGLIGYGAWGSHHARAIHACDQAELVAIVETSEERRAAARAEYPNARIRADLDEMLNADAPEIVSIALPNHLHVEAAKTALQADKHLLLEKPMTNTIEQCNELIRIARDRHRTLALVHQLRVSSLWSRAKQLIDEGAIGKPLYALVELWRNPYRSGSDGWRFDYDRVGSWILEEPIHFFDLARWYFAGEGDPVSVYARANARQQDHPELQDNFSATLNFPDGGFAVIAQTLAAWEHHQVAKLTGTDGALWAAWSGEMDRTFHPEYSLKLQRKDTIEEISIERPPGEVYELEDVVADMIEAVRENRPPATTGEDGRWAVEMCIKSEQSVASGGPVAF